MPKTPKKPLAAKPLPESTGPPVAERLTITLFETDTAAIKRLRVGMFVDTDEFATASEIIRFLLRDAPKTLDAKRFLALRAKMKEEDGRSKRPVSGVEK